MATLSSKPPSPSHYTDPAQFVRNWARFSRGLPVEIPERPGCSRVQHLQAWDEVMVRVWALCPELRITDDADHTLSTDESIRALVIVDEFLQATASAEIMNKEIARLADFTDFRKDGKDPIVVTRVALAQNEVRLVTLARPGAPFRKVAAVLPPLYVHYSCDQLDIEEIIGDDYEEDNDDINSRNGWVGTRNSTHMVDVNPGHTMHWPDHNFCDVPIMDETPDSASLATTWAVSLLDHVYSEDIWTRYFGTEFGKKFEA